MPPLIPATLLKAVIFPPRHHHPSSPFIYAKERKPVTKPLRIDADVRRKVLDRIGTTGNALLLLKAPRVRGGRRGWMRSVSVGTLLVMVREGEALSTQARRWTCRGVDWGRSGVLIQATGSIQSLEGELDVNGGYEKEEEGKEEHSPPGILPTVLMVGRVAAVPLLVIGYRVAKCGTTQIGMSMYLSTISCMVGMMQSILIYFEWRFWCSYPYVTLIAGTDYKQLF